jgi:hypothetical protein
MCFSMDAGNLRPLPQTKERIMKTRHAIILSFSLGLFSASAAHAGDAILGAIVGGGLGAAIGHQVGGRDGTLIGGAIGAATGAILVSGDSHRHHGPVYRYAPPVPARVYAPMPVYVPAPVYAPMPVYYQAPRRVVHVPPPPPPSGKHWQNRRSVRHDAHRR